MDYVKHSYAHSSIIRQDVVCIFRHNTIEVWATENGQHGIVGEFNHGKDAAEIIMEQEAENTKLRAALVPFTLCPDCGSDDWTNHDGVGECNACWHEWDCQPQTNALSALAKEGE